MSPWNYARRTLHRLVLQVCLVATFIGNFYKWIAYCKNPVDNCWYLFDDTKVIPVLEEAVVTADAYLLFYQKSSLNTLNMEPKTNPSTSSISSGYHSSVTCSSSFNINHWAFQMPPFTYYNSNGNSKSSTLPNRRTIQPNRPINQPNNITSQAHKSTNNSAKSPNYEATKPSKHSNNNPNYGHVQQNGNSKRQDPTVPHRTSSGSSSNSYNNTFPRIKSRQASH